MKILVTGGTGYIGSHTVVELLVNNHEVVIVDNLSNSSRGVLGRIEKITGKKPEFIEADLCNYDETEKVFSSNDFDCVIHFAGLKSVSESISSPMKYYDNNINSTLVLLDKMLKHKVKKIIFSSSATVYGTPVELPIKETSQTGVGITNPYGQTKYMIEQMLHDVSASNPDFEVMILRYFNPIGAHESGLIGEDPNGIPNNLFPFVSQVAIGKYPEVKVFGDDYDTPDGTGVRDYIHVVDLAKGHVAALNKFTSGIQIYNLGTGKGQSVLEIIREFSEVSEQTIPFVVAPRRVGDLAELYADTELVKQDLNWEAKKTLKDACRDTWRWQSNNPNGYDN